MIGRNIRNIRILKGFSQEYVSSVLNISQSAYSDIENNKSKLDIKRIVQIANIFEVEVKDLLAFKEDEIFNGTSNLNFEKQIVVNKIMLDSFDQERLVYKELIRNLKEEIDFLRKKIKIIIVSYYFLIEEFSVSLFVI